MYKLIHWDINELVEEVSRYMPVVQQLAPTYPEMVNDLIGLALRDAATGSDVSLDDFVRQNFGSQYHYLTLFFRVQARRWYGEIVRTAARLTARYDEFFIEEIVPLTPTMLLVKVWVEFDRGASIVNSENY